MPTRIDICASRFVKLALLALALAARPGQMAPAAAEEGWTAKLETEAERAYRSVYERSLAIGKPQQAPAKAQAPKQVKAAKSGEPAIPDLPVRDERRLAQPAAPATTAAAPEAAPETGPIRIDTPATPAPAPAGKTGWRSPMDLMGNPVIPEPNLDEVITTQVLGDDQDQPAESRRGPPGPADQYCSNIANAATDARFAWQKQTLLQTEEQIKQRVEELKGKIAEYQKWLARRDEFSRKAQAVITDIYAKMKPDAAAQQLMALDDETAAAVVTKLNPRVASALMAEMDPKQAARLTAIIAGSAKGPKGKPPAKPQPGGT
jgi:flagellar motility protein MotE (MotC chaperone)